MTKRTTNPLFIGALACAAALCLSGCSAFEVLQKQSTASYDDLAALSQSSEVKPKWVPEDATDITVRTSTLEDAEDAVVLLQSTSPLPSDICEEATRLSAPSWTLDGAPDVYKLDSVFVCGDWTVAPTKNETGWFGWTPNSEAEREEAAQ